MVLLAQPRNRAAVSRDSYRGRVPRPEVPARRVLNACCCLPAWRPRNESDDCLRQAAGSNAAQWLVRKRTQCFKRRVQRTCSSPPKLSVARRRVFWCRHVVGVLCSGMRKERVASRRGIWVGGERHVYRRLWLWLRLRGRWGIAAEVRWRSERVLGRGGRRMVVALGVERRTVGEGVRRASIHDYFSRAVDGR